MCLTLCDPRDCSPPGSSVHGILQARILEWVAIPFPGGLPDPGIEPRPPALEADALTSEPYLWAFYFVPLICISVFVPVPYCLDDCSFVVESEVRQVDSSSSILLSQDYFGYSRFFVFPYKL